MSTSDCIRFLLKVFLLGSLVVFFGTRLLGKPHSLEEEKMTAVETARIEKMVAEIETTNRGDILEIGRDGTRLLVAVVGPRYNRRHDTIVYERFGGSIRQETTAHGLIAGGVVRVHRMDTPEWNKKAVEFFKQ